MPEVAEIRERYKRRSLRSQANYDFSEFVFQSRNERELICSRWLRRYLNTSSCKGLEIGAGFGDNYHLLRRVGFQPESIYLNELLEERLNHLRRWIPSSQLIVGDICEVNESLNGTFDLVLQSTVLSSVLKDQSRIQIFNRVQELLRPGGLFLSYDFTFNNPQNKDVRRVTLTDLKSGLPHFELLEWQRVTLAPPLARRLGRSYGFFNACLPFLRTHLLTLWRLKNSSAST